MRRILLFVLPLLLAAAVFGGFQYVQSKQAGKGALQVTSHPDSTVYLNGQQIGKTPLCKCQLADMLATGEYTVKVVPLEGTFPPFEEKITIGKGVLTVVDRIFQEGASSEGNVITLTPLDNKNSLELLVLSFPQKADVYIDNNPSGDSPFVLRNITESDHEIKLSKTGYRDKSVRIRTVQGYKVTATVFMGINPNVVSESPTPLPSSAPSTTPAVAKVIILQTPTGFLRVRAEASVASAEIGRVSPGDSLDLVSETEGWYQIKLPDKSIGWISSQYASKQ